MSRAGLQLQMPVSKGDDWQADLSWHKDHCRLSVTTISSCDAVCSSTPGLKSHHCVVPAQPLASCGRTHLVWCSKERKTACGPISSRMAPSGRRSAVLLNSTWLRKLFTCGHIPCCLVEACNPDDAALKTSYKPEGKSISSAWVLRKMLRAYGHRQPPHTHIS